MSSYYSIIGPTGSGKTGVIMRTAEQLLRSESVRRVAIVSADSRQVYKGLEVVTGADIPANFSPISVRFSPHKAYAHTNLNVSLFGCAMISPLSEWSAAHFSDLLSSVLAEYNWPIDRVFVVGGTMLYHSIFEYPNRESQPGPDPVIRKKAEGMTVEELQSWLTSIDESSLEKMNESDRNNPRRLVRAIERDMSPENKEAVLPLDWQHEWYGLMPDREVLEKNIAQRVLERFENGAQQEAIELRVQIEDRGLNPRQLPAWTACGVPYLDAFLQGEITQDQCLTQWTTAELRYVKRQLAWWKKQTDITWFAEKADLQNKLLHL